MAHEKQRFLTKFSITAFVGNRDAAILREKQKVCASLFSLPSSPSLLSNPSSPASRYLISRTADVFSLFLFSLPVVSLMAEKRRRQGDDRDVYSCCCGGWRREEVAPARFGSGVATASSDDDYPASQSPSPPSSPFNMNRLLLPLHSSTVYTTAVAQTPSFNSTQKPSHALYKAIALLSFLASISQTSFSGTYKTPRVVSFRSYMIENET